MPAGIAVAIIKKDVRQQGKIEDINQSKPNKNEPTMIAPRSGLFWTTTSGAAFVFSSVLIGLMLWATNKGWITGPNGPFVRYSISIALGISVAAFTVGGLKAYAAVKGKILGVNIQIGGALAAVAITVAGSFYVTKQNDFSQGFYFNDARTQRPIEAEAATIILQLDNGPKETSVGPNGYAEFRELPIRLLDSTQTLTIKSSRYSIEGGKVSVHLSGKPITQALSGNDPIMREVRKKIHLNVLGLYAPLRVLAGNTFGNNDEAHVANFQKSEVVKALVSTDLRSNPGKMTTQNLAKLFVYLSEEPTWKQELLNATGSHHDRLARAALRFCDFYNDLSMTDKRYLSDEELSSLHRLRNTMFVERMKNSVGLPANQIINKIPKLELDSLFQAMAGVEDKLGPLNLYLVTF